MRHIRRIKLVLVIMHKEAVKRSTESYLNTMLEQTEDKAGVSMTDSLIDSTVFLDKYSNSLLIAAGAAITLAIGNSEAVISTLGKGSFKAFVILLLLSAIVGFVAKFFHSVSIMFVRLVQNLESRINGILDDYDGIEKAALDEVGDDVEVEPRELSLEKVFESFINTFPQVYARASKLRCKE